MRFLSVLIAVLVLALNCMPCSDAGMWAHESSNRAVSGSHQQAGHRDSSKEEHQDLCSPFCQCACCSLAYALPLCLLQDMTVKAGWCGSSFPLWVQHYPSGIALPVWQPPQLV